MRWYFSDASAQRDCRKTLFRVAKSPGMYSTARFAGQNAPGIGISIAWGLLERPKTQIFPILCTGANIVHPLWILRAMGSGSCACERKCWQTPAQTRRAGVWRLPVGRESDTGALQNLPQEKKAGHLFPDARPFFFTFGLIP